MTLIIFGAILTIISVVISYFRTTWRKLVLIIGITGAIVALVQGYRNQQRAYDLQKQLSETRRVLPRMLTDEQMTEVVEGVRPFAGQAFSIQTYVGLTECMGIANRIYDALKSGNWKYLGGVVWRPHGPFIDNGLPIQNKFGFGELPPIPITGIWVRVEPKTEEKTKNAAKALVDALSHAKIDAQVSSYFAMESAPSDANGPHFVESPEKATNIIEIHVGTKRD